MPISSYDTAGSFLLLGCTNGSIYYIGMYTKLLGFYKPLTEVVYTYFWWQPSSSTLHWNLTFHDYCYDTSSVLPFTFLFLSHFQHWIDLQSVSQLLSLKLSILKASSEYHHSSSPGWDGSASHTSTTPSRCLYSFMNWITAQVKGFECLIQSFQGSYSMVVSQGIQNPVRIKVNSTWKCLSKIKIHLVLHFVSQICRSFLWEWRIMIFWWLSFIKILMRTWWRHSASTWHQRRVSQ